MGREGAQKEGNLFEKATFEASIWFLKVIFPRMGLIESAKGRE